MTHGPPPRRTADAGKAPPDEPIPPPPLSQAERDLVIAALGPAPVDIDALVRGTGLPTRAVQVVLIELALAGRIERHGNGLVSLA
jgi:DNA processing protein